MRVLSFGHIPTYVGGKQSSGLANVIYQLAFYGAKQEDVEMTLAATDVFVPVLKKEELTILGWTRKLLVCHALLHIGATIRIIVNTIKSKKKYSASVSIPSLFLKSVFLDYAIRKVRPDVIHLHGANSILYSPLLSPELKLVVTLHGDIGNDENLPLHEIYAKMERAICSSNRIDMLCTISTSLTEIFENMYGEIRPKHRVILNAYDDIVYKYTEPRKQNKLTLCTIASFSKRKGQERVIEALLKSHCDYGYRCVGYISDSDKDMLEKKARGVDFQWLGVKKPTEIREILAECDYMILPSSSEGFGLVYLEAIACGVPVIIPKNLPLALEGDILNKDNAIRINGCSAEAIEEVLPSLPKREWNRKEVSQSIISYTWDNIAKEYRNIYSSLIK